MAERKLVEALRSKEGQDLAEYAMLAVLIAVAVIAALSLVAPSISAMYQTIAAGL
jgi:Flp pilus assembly pilin Flp